MTQNDMENLDSTNETETTENKDGAVDTTDTTEEDGAPANEEETITIPKNKWTETLAQKEHWREKAEGKTPTSKSEADSGLSARDAIALAKADIHDDDVDEVIEYARFKKIPIAEALKSPMIKATLETKAEQRRTANATNTGNARRGPVKVSDEALEAKVKAGQLPESDEEIDRLLRNRIGKKK